MYPQSYVLQKERKISKTFHLKIIIFKVLKYHSILHGHSEFCQNSICILFNDNTHNIPVFVLLFFFFNLFDVYIVLY